MEIKLTADWIFLHDCEVHCNEDAECYVTIYGEFQNYLAELALKTMKNVNFSCEELYADTDVHYDNPFFRYLFIDIEEIRDSAPLLYSEFLKSIHEEGKRQQYIENKQTIILKFLETPRTLNQIHNHLENEFYKKEEYYELNKSSLISHTEYTIHELIDDGLVKLENENYSLV